jgi:hypothetical protein
MGGFDVSVSWTTGNNYGCDAGKGNTVCVWYNTAHTAYTVENGMLNDCTGFQSTGGSLIMFSPNSNNAGCGYYCVSGAQYCRNQGAAYWDYSGRAGGS